MLFHQSKTLSHRGIVWLGGNRLTPNHPETFLTFDLTVGATHLWVAPSNELDQLYFLRKITNNIC